MKVDKIVYFVVCIATTHDRIIPFVNGFPALEDEKAFNQHISTQIIMYDDVKRQVELRMNPKENNTDKFKSILHAACLQILQLQNENKMLTDENNMLTARCSEMNLIIPMLAEQLCGQNLRYYMDTFSINYLNIHGPASKNSKAVQLALKNIGIYVKQKSDTIYNKVAKLYELCEYYNDKLTMTPREQEGWSNQVKEVYLSLKSFYYTRDPEMPVKLKTASSLMDLIVDFRDSETAAISVAVFQDQCNKCFWSRLNFDFNSEYTVLKKWGAQASNREIKIVMDQIQNKLDNVKLNRPEYTFVKNLFKSGTYFYLSDKKERYEECATVFYFGRTEDIDKLTEIFSDRWPKQKDDFAGMVDKFCHSFVNLYNLISMTSIHAPAALASSLKCEPNSTLYANYLNRIAPSPQTNSNFRFVATVLGVYFQDKEKTD